LRFGAGAIGMMACCTLRGWGIASENEPEDLPVFRPYPRPLLRIAEHDLMRPPERVKASRIMDLAGRLADPNRKNPIEQVRNKAYHPTPVR
jgi:hypothetical protein